MVLLAMALVVILATGMTRQQSLRVFKAGHYLIQQQGLSVALGAEAFAHQILITDYEEDKKSGAPIDSLDEFWAANSVVLPLDDDGVAEIQLDGLGGRLNLNDLIGTDNKPDSVSRERLDRLLQNLQITGLKADVFVDWVDANDEAIGVYGAEDGQYLLAQPGYRAANQPFASVTELRLLEGMTEESYQALRPFVAALPVSGLGINVNTASAEVLQTLHPDLNAAQVNAVIERRREQRFESINEFLALQQFSGLGLRPEGLTVQTRFFEVVARISYGKRVVHMVSTVYRNPEGKVSTLHRDTGQKNRITKAPFTILEG
ncbi:MAG TPA: type II secretion system minor pseudopilin GspK [Marinobacter sp.]|nr:type II secretion system minor pseudopilin GspK [Marinobacter sp.]